MRLPNPAIVICVCPVTVCVEIFCSPDVLVVILNVVAQTLREETFTLAHPVVDRIMRSVSDELPIAFVIARYNKFCGATVTKNKSRRVRVDTSTATIAHSQ